MEATEASNKPDKDKGDHHEGDGWGAILEGLAPCVAGALGCELVLSDE